MNLKELHDAVLAANPDLRPAQVKTTLNLAFNALRTSLEQAEEGFVYTPLGRVRVLSSTAPDGTQQRRLLLTLKHPKAPGAAEQPATPAN